MGYEITAPKPRRIRSDTVQGATEAFQSASQVIEWPADIPRSLAPADAARELVFFNIIIAERQHDDWSPLAVITAARCAGAMALSARLQSQIDSEGPTLLGGKRGDVKVVNPAMNGYQMMQASLTQLLRQLGLASPTVDKRQLANAAAAERAAKSVLAKVATDDLLA